MKSFHEGHGRFEGLGRVFCDDLQTHPGDGVGELVWLFNEDDIGLTMVSPSTIDVAWHTMSAVHSQPASLGSWSLDLRLEGLLNHIEK